ncbi:DMT family transporter [Paenibacillus glycinis]|uniref:EamA family transporter n=1 Tax=Paenibacillus glycinis TaxID=2697035 RepID=A0ABW9XIH3_9BACL|nr:DMT family transporter [Paenibacillus glycinis]NBD22274.1 EamA family transporter [Paenibacillus glycinis]
MSDKSVVFQLLGVTLLWGGNYVASAYLLTAFSPILLAFLRLTVTCLLLIGVCLRRGGIAKPNRQEWALLILIGVTSSLLYQIFYFVGLAHTSAGNAALIIALSPVATAFLARAFLKERMTGFQLLGALVALAGVALIVLNGGNVTDASSGDYFILLAMAMLASSVLLIRKAAMTMKSRDVTLYSTLIGTLLMIPAAGAERLQGHLHYGDHSYPWALLIVMALFAQGMAGLWWNRGISKVGASASAMYMNIPPFVAILVAYAVLGDPIRLAQIAGGALIAAGVAIANAKAKNTSNRGDFVPWRRI